MKRWLFVLGCAWVLLASCGDPLDRDVAAGGGPDGGDGGDDGNTAAEGGPANDAGVADGDAMAAYDAPPDVHPNCGTGIDCAPDFGCCVHGNGTSCEEIGDCSDGTFLECSVSSQCGAGRCCVTPDASINLTVGRCRAACAPGDLVLCDKNDSLENHGCAASQTCSGANLDAWGLSGVDTYAGCQPP